MLTLKMKQKYLKKMTDIASLYSAEIKMEIHQDDGLVMVQVIDPAHVAFSVQTTLIELFDQYDNPDGLTEMYLDLDKIKEVLKLTSAEDDITMTYDTEKGKIGFKFNNLTRRCGIPMCEIKDFKAPAVNFDLVMSIPANEMSKYLSACDGVADFITLRVENGKAKMLAEKDSGDSVDIDLEQYRKGTKDVKAGYPLDYMQGFFKAMGAETVDLAFDSDYPVVMTSSINEGMTTVTAMVAPRIEE